LEKAKKYLDFAVLFTPQYGDSFIEYLKLQYLMNGNLSKNDNNINIDISNENLIENLCINSEPNYGPLWFYCKFNPLENTKDIFKNSKLLIKEYLYLYKNYYQNSMIQSFDFLEENNEIIDKSNFISALPLSLIYHTDSKSDNLKKKLIFGFIENII
jgi:hypothetical protein